MSSPFSLAVTEYWVICEEKELIELMVLEVEVQDQGASLVKGLCCCMVTWLLVADAPLAASDGLCGASWTSVPLGLLSHSL